MTTPFQMKAAQVIAELSLNGFSFKLPLYRAASAGIITLCQPARDDMPPFKAMDRIGRPVAVLVGDDDYASTGPSGWAAANRLRYWARGAMVHGTGGSEQDYAVAVAMAQARGKFVLIETDSAHLIEWADLIRSAPVTMPALMLRPTAPGLHPIPLKKEQVQ